MGALSKTSLLLITLCPAFAQTTTGFVPLVNIAGTAARLPTLKGIAVDAADSGPLTQNQSGDSECKRR